MKLIVQIQCQNEEATLIHTVADIPRIIPGIDEVELLIIDDGCTDHTVAVAQAIGVEHVVRNTARRGQSGAFQTGVEACLQFGADIIVNTEGNNQYAGGDIPKLIQPILDGAADIVIGDRRIGTMVRNSGAAMPDAASGFRAISRDAALRTNIVPPFSRSTDMLFQVDKKKFAIVSVPVGGDPKVQDSKQSPGMPNFVAGAVHTFLGIGSLYRPLRAFQAVGLFMSLIGLAPIVLFLFHYFTGDGAGYVQSLLIGGAMLTMGLMTFLVGLMADLISHNRQLAEMTLEKVRRLELVVSGGGQQITNLARRIEKELPEPIRAARNNLSQVG